MTALQSAEAFGELYLRGKYLTVASCGFHRELHELLKEASEKRGARIAIAAPRGSAKSTIVSAVYGLWCICTGREQYIVLFSDTAQQAIDALSFIKKELEHNPLLRQDFPEACEVPGQSPGPPRWRQEEIITRNGVKVTALGAGQNVRGRRHEQHRPTLIILDDVENLEGAQSLERRKKLQDWFERSVLKTGSKKTNVVVIGTILHYDSLLARLIDPERSPGWVSRRYRAVIHWAERVDLWEAWVRIYDGQEEHQGAKGPEAASAFYKANEAEMLRGTEVLWPEHESYYDLVVQRERDGRVSFDAEKQNEPVNPAECLFREEYVHYWEDDYRTEHELLTALGGRCHLIGACDPSLGRKGQSSDFTAIITLARDVEEGVLYVLDAEIARLTPDETIEAIIRLGRYRPYVAFGFEANQFQEFVGTTLLRRAAQQGVRLPVIPVTHTNDKVGRIQSLQPSVKGGTIRFSRRHHQLLEQLRYFPKAAHDDGPDALELAMRMVEALQPRERTEIIFPDRNGNFWLPPGTRIVGNFLEGWIDEEVF